MQTQSGRPVDTYVTAKAHFLQHVLCVAMETAHREMQFTQTVLYATPSREG